MKFIASKETYGKTWAGNIHVEAENIEEACRKLGADEVATRGKKLSKLYFDGGVYSVFPVKEDGNCEELRTVVVHIPQKEAQLI